MEQVARLSNAKQQSDEAARDLVEAQRQIRRLEDTVAFLTAASQEASASPRVSHASSSIFLFHQISPRII